jgi:RNA polymerase sigma-70 factor (ECF subfamily)
MEKKDHIHKIIDFLYHEYRQFIYNICYSILKDYHSAQDARQDALIYINELIKRGQIHMHNYQTVEVKRLIAHITKCRAINIYRKKSKAPVLVGERAFLWQYYGATAASMDECLIAKERTAEILAAILDLPPIYRDSLVLFYQYEYSRTEISHLLGISYNAAKLRIARGKRILSHFLRERGIEEDSFLG